MASSKEAASEILSVHELMNETLTSVPERYIQIEPSAFQDESLCHEIPTISLKNLIHGDAIELNKLDSACRDWGFFQLVEHGISPQVLETLKDETEEFFKLPLQEKMKYKIRPGDVEGYGAVILSEDQKLNWGDRFFMVTNPLTMRKSHLFPELPSSLRNILESYIMEVQNLGMTLFGLLGKALKMEEWKHFENGMQSVRMGYYPPCPQPELVMGFKAHTDAAGITILNQVNGVHGLQIKKNGIWIPVNITSHALVVNVGDTLEIMSNGAYKSAEHRATVNSEKERISIAMFFLPQLQHEIGPAISLTNPENPPLFKRLGMEKYVKDYFTCKTNEKYLQHLRIKDEKITNETV